MTLTCPCLTFIVSLYLLTAHLAHQQPLTQLSHVSDDAQSVYVYLNLLVCVFIVCVCL